MTSPIPLALTAVLGGLTGEPPSSEPARPGPCPATAAAANVASIAGGVRGLMGLPGGVPILPLLELAWTQRWTPSVTSIVRGATLVAANLVDVDLDVRVAGVGATGLSVRLGGRHGGLAYGAEYVHLSEAHVGMATTLARGPARWTTWLELGLAATQVNIRCPGRTPTTPATGWPWPSRAGGPFICDDAVVYDTFLGASGRVGTTLEVALTATLDLVTSFAVGLFDPPVLEPGLHVLPEVGLGLAFAL